MNTKVKFSKEKLYKGVEVLAEAVGSTLGPKGRTVIIEHENGFPYITKDGVTVAGQIKPSDTLERLGSTIVSQSAQSTVRAAGDGTTTSIVLSNAIIQHAKHIENAVDAIKGIEKASKETLELLEEKTEEMTPEMIGHIAYISTNNSEELGTIVKDAFVESGEDGIVDMQVSATADKVTLEVKPGSFIPNGYANESFINNLKQRTCELEGAMVLVSNLTIDSHTKVLGLLEHAIKTRTPFIVIADTEEEFDEAFVMNVAKGNIQGCVIKPGQFVDTAMLRDLATLLGATYFDNSHGNNLEHITVQDLGKVDKATIGKGYTLFTVEELPDLSENIDTIKGQLETATTDHQKRSLKARLSMLNGKRATITVGAPTQAQRDEIKDRVEDAIQAIGAAHDFGYLAGGGVSLRDASRHLVLKLKGESGSSFNEGYSAFIEALNAPYKKILSNSGIELPKYDQDFGNGVDASNGEYVNMIKAGIIDPALVTKQAVVNATSSACALLHTKATIIKDEVESDQ